jgi:hypothetical protein
MPANPEKRQGQSTEDDGPGDDRQGWGAMGERDLGEKPYGRQKNRQENAQATATAGHRTGSRVMELM